MDGEPKRRERMELRQIQYFVQLYKDCNMTKSSQALYISQQGLSKSVSKLEAELGFPLFRRTSSGVTPTESARSEERRVGKEC